MFLYQADPRVLQRRYTSSPDVSKDIARYFDHLQHKNIQSLRSKKKVIGEPKSFGVYLGTFSNPPSLNEARVLSRWNAIIVDPLQQGILEALSSYSSQPVAEQKIGRLDIDAIVGVACNPENSQVVQSVDLVVQTLITRLRHAQHTDSPLTGVLLANWQRHLAPAVCNRVLKFMAFLNIDAYLEIVPPTYLTHDQCLNLDTKLIRGMVCRNGTILSNGNARDYYQMSGLRRALRAVAKYQSLSASSILMWEAIDDSVDLSHSVAKRSSNWCRFNSALSWIGPEAAMNNANIATTSTLPGEPLGALMWLKSNEIMKLHEIWRKNDNITKKNRDNHTAYDSLDSLIPNLAVKLTLMPVTTETDHENDAGSRESFDAIPWKNHTQMDPFSFSASGHKLDGIGCFPIGLDCSPKDFSDLVIGQRRLKDLELLEKIRPEELQLICENLSTLEMSKDTRKPTTKQTEVVEELVNLLGAATGSEDDCLKVYVGLHSGFRNTLDSFFWGLYNVDPIAKVTEIYISGNTTDRTGTILHTFLSSRQCTRSHCFMTELDLAEKTENLSPTTSLPPRFVQDIEQLTPTENHLLLRHLVSTNHLESSPLSKKIQECCKYQLLETPSLSQLRALNTSGYLSGEVSAEDLVISRIAWFRERGCWHPDQSSAISVFKEIDSRLSKILLDQQSQLLSQLESALEILLRKDCIDAGADIFALSIFCAFRKLALEEVYLEVLDRNPLPNPHPDQAACFAEMFALGSQCESYLDMTSNALGRILTDKYHSYYKQHQPPLRDDKTTELPTTYSSSQVDLDTKPAYIKLPMHYKVTFLAIFAGPALVDILLLSTIGRGLYLSTYMADIEKTMATAALMVSLLLCGAVGTWIGSGGSYYLYSMAFPAMNMFVLTRFVTGIAVSLGVGTIALIIIGIVKSFYGGFIFFLYLALLSTYFILLATLAIYQLPGFKFQSGRSTIAVCLPVLLLSPILTLWVGHDIVVYPCVLVSLVGSLLLGARKVISQWGSWYLEVPCISDTEVVDWYKKTRIMEPEDLEVSGKSTDLAATPLPRSALAAAITEERERRPWEKSTADELVIKLVRGYDATTFLMDWYCKYSRTNMPYLYSPTWNLQCKAAIDTLKDMQKGLKLHNAFIHWRHAGDEVWCGILYFVIALMDKWTALISGGSLVGLSDADSATFRLAVGFSLAYYLVAAVCLDSVAYPLWAMANKKTDQPITSLQFLQEAAVNDARARRRLYWGNFFKFLFLHFWGLCIAAALMWTFEESRSATIMFMGYVGAYTGLLWYQYNRVYTGPRALKDLVAAAVAGIVTGPTLFRALPQFEFSGVVALGIATWTSAILSLRTAKVGRPKSKDASEKVTEAPASYFGNAHHAHHTPSRNDLSEMFDTVCSLEQDFRYRVDPKSYPGLEVMTLLRARESLGSSSIVRTALPLADCLIPRTIALWEKGDIVVDIVSTTPDLPQSNKMRSISRVLSNQLHILVFIRHDLEREAFRQNAIIIAELLIQATAETRCDLPHDQSSLYELLLVDLDDEKATPIPEGIKSRLECSPSDRARVLKNQNKELLRHIMLGMDCDKDWDSLPRAVRSTLLQRCCGEAYILTTEQSNCILSRLGKEESFNVGTYVAQCNLGATLARSIHSYAKSIDARYDSHDQPRLLDADYHMGLENSHLLGTTHPGAQDNLLKRLLSKIFNNLRFTIKLIVIAFIADPEYQRELDYTISRRWCFIRWPAKVLLNGIWIYCKALQRIVIPWFLFHRREKMMSLRTSMRGTKTILEKHRIIIEGLDGPSTGFFRTQSDGCRQIRQYSGKHDKEPNDDQHLMAINTYTDKLVLRRREEFTNHVNHYEYEYPLEGPDPGSKVPILRRCLKGDSVGQEVQYNEDGHITSGSYLQADNLVKFKLWYRKHAKFHDELLRAEFVLPQIKMLVSWCVPPRKNPDQKDTWIPYTKVTEATFIQHSEVFHSVWSYDHKYHPVITTTLHGRSVATPSMIAHDWFGILRKPTNCTFLSDNLLFSFKSVNTSLVSRLLGLNKRYYPISTARARTHLWKSWKGGKDLDAVTVRWLDEEALRHDRVLGPYWLARDIGQLKAAEGYLDLHSDAIMARADIDPEVSSWSSLAFKLSDLYTFGQGGDARINTRKMTTQMKDSDETLHVLAMDTGTWPNEGGGVSACRRDMVNDLKTIRWHVLAEMANDFGTPKFQIERNVQSLTILPLWGLDFLTPTHGVFQDYLDSEVQQKSFDTSEADIVLNFMPILVTLVRCSRAIKIEHHHIEEATRALVDLNTYFESSRHWTKVWTSDVVKEKWRELWLTEELENARPVSEWLDAEKPTLLHMDNALDMWHRCKSRPTLYEGRTDVSY